MKFFKRSKNLRKYYTIFLEVGMIGALVIFLIAFKIDYRPEAEEQVLTDKQEIVDIEEIVRTKQEELPPPPPRPQIPTEVPNDEIVEEAEININSELDFSQKLAIPPPPKQEEESDREKEEQVFVIVEQPPKLIGGLQALQAKIEYPEMARKAGIEGRVYVQFIVNKKGEVEDPKVVRGIGGGCDQEALRVIKTARFKPGLQRGMPVNVRYSMPIVFRLTAQSVN